MLPSYSDIIEKAGKPLWFDENGVSRYVEFHPNRCVMAGTQEVVLAEVMCQGCGTSFLVALSWRDGKREIYGQASPPADRLTKTDGNSLHYGDPPNIGCCAFGPTMTSDFHRIVEAWIRSAGPGGPWVKLGQEAINAIGAKSEVGAWE